MAPRFTEKQASDVRTPVGASYIAESYVGYACEVHLHLVWRERGNYCAVFHRAIVKEVIGASGARRKPVRAQGGSSGDVEVPVLVYIREVLQGAETGVVVPVPSVARLRPHDSCDVFRLQFPDAPEPIAQEPLSVPGEHRDVVGWNSGVAIDAPMLLSGVRIDFVANGILWRLEEVANRDARVYAVFASPFEFYPNAVEYAGFTHGS